MGAAVMFNMTQKMWLCPYIIVAISCLDFDLTQLISFPAFLCFDQMWTAEILCSIETITIGGLEQRRKKQQKKHQEVQPVRNILHNILYAQASETFGFAFTKPLPYTEDEISYNDG